MRLKQYRYKVQHHEHSMRTKEPDRERMLVRPAKAASGTLQTYLIGRVNHSPIRDWV